MARVYAKLARWFYGLSGWSWRMAKDMDARYWLLRSKSQ